MHLILRGCRYDLRARPLVMGVLNVTPDSFSDGGAFLEPYEAADRAEAIVREGGDLIDIGAESTRPGASPTPERVQVDRAIPVIRAIRERGIRQPISIDTRSAMVASAALDAGADMINDISGMRDDPDTVRVVAARGVPIVLMHMSGTPANMQDGGGPEYADLFGEMIAFFEERIAVAEAAGVQRDAIVLDPGIGFGKRLAHNLAILRNLRRLEQCGRPILVGASRKRMIGSVLGITDPKERLYGSLACAVVAAMNGASIIRVHDVAPTVQALRMLAAIHSGEAAEAPHEQGE